MFSKKLFFLYFIFVSFSFANFRITNYEENIKFTEYGRYVKMKIKGIVELQSNYYQSGWSYIFDPKQKIEIVDVKVIGKKFKTNFNSNRLNFEFDNTYNAEVLEFIVEYKETSKKTKYNRQEWVSIPEFVDGAVGVLSVEIPDIYAVYSTNKPFTQNYNIYEWSGKIKNGFKSLFLLTLKRAKWNVSANVTINSDTNFKKLDVTIPQYLKNGNNHLESYEILTEGKFLEKNGEIKVNFDNYERKVGKITLKAIIMNDFDNKTWIKVNPNNEIKIENVLSNKLQSVLNQIQFSFDDTIPLHIKIAKWVHKNITYDLSYFGRDLKTEQIISIGRGVCEHYAQVYNHLLRAANIPSIVVSGMSYDTEKDKFEGHAWNLVYINGEWIGIDPTWDLYSGKLPVSHVFFNFKTETPELQWSTYNDNTNAKFERTVEYLE